MRADLGSSVNRFIKKMPSPPLPFEGLAMKVNEGFFLMYSSSSTTSSGRRKEAGVKEKSSGKKR